MIEKRNLFILYNFFQEDLFTHSLDLSQEISDFSRRKSSEFTCFIYNTNFNEFCSKLAIEAFLEC